MNTTEKHYQDWLETYVALVLGENKAYTNFRRDVCRGKFLYVKKFCNTGACAKKLTAPPLKKTPTTKQPNPN